MIERNKTKFLNADNVIILLTLIVVAIVTFFRASERIPVMEDLEYMYVYSLHPDYQSGLKLVDSFSDIWYGMIDHYQLTNGRFWVHILVQLLAWKSPFVGFGIFDAFAVVAVLCLLAKFSFRTLDWRNSMLWVILVLAWFYFFPRPEDFWFEINTVCNYIIPAILSLIWWLVWPKYCEKQDWTAVVAMTILAFFTGWSQEGFAVPLCGAMFVYATVNRKSMTAAKWWAVIVLWIATAIMVFAPGNFVRINGNGGIIQKLFNSIDLFCQAKVVWILLASIVVCYIKDKVALITQIKADYLVWCALCVSLAFGIVANSYIQSFTGQEFYSLIIIFRLWPIICPRRLATNLRAGVALALLAIFAGHQVLIIEAQRRVDEKQQRWLENYKNSTTEFQPFLELDIPAYAKPYMRNWFRNGLNSDCNPSLLIYGYIYGRYQRPVTFLGEGDKYLLQEFKKTGKLHGDTIPGDLHFVQGERFLWTTCQVDTVYARMEKQKLVGLRGIIARFKREDKKEISYNFAVNKVVVENSDTIYYFKKPGFRIISLDSK